jgi:hypothetical protein
MSLIAFHRLLIATAILFSLGFAVRQFSEFQTTGKIWALVAVVLLGIVAAVLGYYLAHLRDFLKLPATGGGQGPGSDVNGGSGNGGRSLPPVIPILTKPAGPRVSGNGHDEQAVDETQARLKR